jgi:hypothetical protein
VSAGLTEDGFDVRGFQARALTAREVETARRVVTINLDAPGASLKGKAVDRWEGIPAASDDYAAARDALTRRIHALLDQLASSSDRP